MSFRGVVREGSNFNLKGRFSEVFHIVNKNIRKRLIVAPNYQILSFSFLVIQS